MEKLFTPIDKSRKISAGYYITVDLDNKIKLLAEANNTTMSEVVRVLLNIGIEDLRKRKQQEEK